MLKKVAYLLAIMAVFSGCKENLSDPQDNEIFSVSGQIIEPNADISRLIKDLHVTAKNGSSGKSYTGAVVSKVPETCQYSFTDIPKGEYDILFSSSLYEDLAYPIRVDGNKTLDVSLSPIAMSSLTVEKLYFASRVRYQEFSITNISGKDFYFTLKLDPVADHLVRTLSGLQKVDGGWFGELAAGETKQVSIEILRSETESKEGTLSILVNGLHDLTIPFVVETTNKDFYADVAGQVTDTQGNPLKDIPVFCNCSGTMTLTDKDGRYRFDEIPYISMIQITADPEFYTWKRSESKEYKIEEVELNLTLEPCANHLSFDKREIDFGTGSISASAGPETISITATSETGEPVAFYVQSELGQNGMPSIVQGLGCSPVNGMFISPATFTFQLDRSKSEVGEFQTTFFMTTENAGTYFFPVKFTNTK